MAAVEFRKVDIIFGKNPEAALGLLDSGQTRDARDKGVTLCHDNSGTLVRQGAGHCSHST